jgi:signal transduction histidine kinase/CheY-like chemotaxis protein
VPDDALDDADRWHLAAVTNGTEEVEDPCRAAIVPIGLATDQPPQAWLVAGVSRLQRVDVEYTTFLELVAAQIGAAVNSVRAFEAEHERAERLEEIDRFKTAVFTNVSHELRTPLTLMLAPLADALRDPAAAADPTWIPMAYRNGQRLLRMVNGLLDLSRLDAKQLTPDARALDLGRLTTELAGMFSSAAERAGLGLAIDTEALMTEVDPRMWEQIVTNLLSNAFRHTFDGGIFVTLHPVDDEVELTVRDTGVGIAPNDLPRVFERFHRVEGARSRSHEGTGIGLALVKELATLLGGTARIDSRLQQGTTVTVRIPVRATNVVAPEFDAVGTVAAGGLGDIEAWVDDDPPAPSVVAQQERDGRTTVLVVDDNADMRAYITRTLSPSFDVMVAANGDDALDLVRRRPPDLLLTDVMMPGTDGLELVRQVRRETGVDELPVILLSARAGPESAVEGLEAGADDYLVKPFAAEDLLARVRARLGVGRERRHRRAFSVLAQGLADAEDGQAVADAVYRVAAELWAASSSSVATVSPDGRSTHRWSSPALPSALEARYVAMSLDAPLPINEAIRDGVALAYNGRDPLPARFSSLEADLRLVGHHAWIVVPMPSVAGAVSGSLAVAWSSPHTVTTEDRAVLDAVADQVERALERIALADRERRMVLEFQHTLLEVDLRSTAAVVAARYRPADRTLMIGGDWYDARTLDDGSLAVAVGDVVGKGLAAAAVMGQLRSALGAAATAATGRDAAGVIRMIERFARRLPRATYATVAYLVLEPSATEIQWCCAGHPAPLLLRDGGATFLRGGRRPSLAVRDSGSDGEAASHPVGPGDLVFMFTDGLVERRTESLDVGLERLRTAVERHHRAATGELCDAVLEEMAPSGGFVDDVAVLALRVAGATDDRYVIVQPSTPRALSEARRSLRAWLAGQPLSPEESDEVLLALGEAATNAAEHGNGFDAEKMVVIEVAIDDGWLRASVSDAGHWDDEVSARNERRGFGFVLMHGVMDDVVVRRTSVGTAVLLGRRLATAAVSR